MNRALRVYFYAVFGAIGGLIGWQVSNMLGLSFGPSLYVSEALVGALVGLCVGLCIGITEGAMTLNIVQAGKSGLSGGLLGMVAGAIGLPLSELFFQTAGAGYLGRALGWGLFGLLIGLLARAVMPGGQHMGLIATMILGLVGAWLGGVIGRHLDLELRIRPVFRLEEELAVEFCRDVVDARRAVGVGGRPARNEVALGPRPRI